MTRLFLAAGVAALAISVPASAKPGHGGNDHGGGKAQANAGGGAKAQGHGGGNAHVAMRAQAHPGGGKDHANVHAQARVKHDDRAREARNDHSRDMREARNDRARDHREARNDRAHDIREARNDRIRDMRNDRRDDMLDGRWDDRHDARVAMGYGVGGCPPGLAKKAVACMPPGQAKKLVGQNFKQLRQTVAFRDLPDRLRYVYRDTPDYYYQYGDGYVYKVNRSNNLISSLLPLFGLGYTAGQQFPTAYNNAYMPAGLQAFYPQTPYSNYRYANGYVYQVNPMTGVIQNVDPMLGYGYGYGQMMPANYSAYNVPYNYRPLYYDTADNYYRYAPGAIYQVDPQTSLITAVSALLSPGMTLGQQMPLGYSAYNVPYDYRAQYYDTQNDWYRYANGNIYRVDPATQLVTSLVAAILT